MVNLILAWFLNEEKCVSLLGQTTAAELGDKLLLIFVMKALDLKQGVRKMS